MGPAPQLKAFVVVHEPLRQLPREVDDELPRNVPVTLDDVALLDLALVERHDREARPLVLRRGLRVGALRSDHGHWRYAQLVQIAARREERRARAPASAGGRNYPNGRNSRRPCLL